MVFVQHLTVKTRILILHYCCWGEQVQPFAGLVGQVPLDVPRLLINREMVGVRDSTCNAGFGTGYFEFGVENTRDAAYLGNCDDGVQQLVDMLDWRSDFDNMFK